MLMHFDAQQCWKIGSCKVAAALLGFESTKYMPEWLQLARENIKKN